MSAVDRQWLLFAELGASGGSTSERLDPALDFVVRAVPGAAACSITELDGGAYRTSMRSTVGSTTSQAWLIAKRLEGIRFRPVPLPQRMRSSTTDGRTRSIQPADQAAVPRPPAAAELPNDRSL